MFIQVKKYKSLPSKVIIKHNKSQTCYVSYIYTTQVRKEFLHQMNLLMLNFLTNVIFIFNTVAEGLFILKTPKDFYNSL